MKKILSAILASSMILSSVAMVSAQEYAQTTTETETLQTFQQETLTSGQCGDNAYYSYDSGSGTLSITGTGAMVDYVAETIDHTVVITSPWDSYRDDIKSVVISEGITTIGDYSFYATSSLTSITIPNSVTTIGKSVFFWCTSLSSVTLGNSVTSIGEEAFYSCNALTSVIIPNSVTTIEPSAFRFCNSLTSVSIGNSVTEIGNAAFSSCSALTSVTFPDSVTEIGNSFFWGCSSLTSVTIPTSVTTIGNSAFSSCSSLTTVYYEGSEADRAAMTFDFLNSDLENATWIYNSTMPSTGTTPTVTPVPEATYPDWMSSFIDFVADDIMPDISPENYSFASNRGLIAQSLYNMCGDGGTYTSNFTDTGDHASAIGWCFENGVMAGSSETWFNAEGNVTREQFALILLQLATVQGFDVSYDLAILSDYPDGTSGNEWAQSGLAWAVKNGLMSGNSDGSLNPIGDVSRVEVAVMLSNFVNLG